jgi:hypothetical protein
VVSTSASHAEIPGSNPGWVIISGAHAMSKSTEKGYPRVATLYDVADSLERHPQIDTIRCAYVPGGLTRLYYVALWSTKEQRGFGGCVVSKKSLEVLEAKVGSRVTFERVGTPE